MLSASSRISTTAVWHSRARHAPTTSRFTWTNFSRNGATAPRFHLATKEKGTLLNKSFQKFPLGEVSFASVRAPSVTAVSPPSFAYFDRTSFIAPLMGTQRVVRALRPKRFGKSLFLSTLKLFHDCALPKDDYVKLFQDTAVMKAVEAGKIKRGQYLILDLDFSKIDRSQNVAQMEASIRNHVNRQVRACWEKYAAHLGAPTVGPTPTVPMPDVNVNDCIESLDNLIERVAEKWSREKPFALFVLIDEYDAVSNEFLNLPEYDKLRSNQMSLLKALYGAFKSSLDDKKIARMFITGVTPLSMADHTSGFNVYQDITFDEEFSAMFGLTEADVRQALQTVLAGDNRRVTEELENMTAMYNGYRFSANSDIAVFNTTTAMEYLQALKKRKAISSDKITEQSEISKPFVHLLAKHTAGRALLQNAILNRPIAAESLSLSYRLEDLSGEEAEQHTKSLLVHLGGLTFKRSFDSNVLGFPNLVARRRVAEVILSHYGLQNSQSLIAAQDQLLLHDKVEPLLNLLTQVLSRTVREDAQLNQLTEADLETYLACLLHTPPPYYMHPQYEIYAGKNSRTGDRYVRYVDIVIQKRESGIASKLWVLELKNRQARFLDPTSFPAGIFPTGRYPHPNEIAEAVSRLPSDEDVKRIRVSPTDKFFPGMTISQILETKAEPQLLQYVAGLKKSNGAASVIAYSVVFVAARRYLCKKYEFN